MRDETPKRAHTRPAPPASETARAGSGTRPNAQAAPKLHPHSTEPEVQTDVVPGYEVLNELGRGAMGVVFRARHVKLNRVVALKMAVGTRVDPKDLIRFLAEAEAVAAVQHDNVVQVYDYGDSDGRPYMALEYCSAGTLSELLRAEAPMDPTDAAEIVGRIAEGVAAAHEQGIIHRDLKPGNVLLQVDPGALARAGLEPGEEDELPVAELTPKVADFGLAKRGVASDLTQTNAVMGTPAYMSPEQAVGKAKFVGPPADVWALGVILYECLTGARPFHGETAYDVLIQIQTEEPVSVRTIQTTVPHDLELIVRKCLEKNPQDRYPTGRELAEDLDRFVRGEPISVRPLSPATLARRWVKRHKAVTGLLAVLVLITLGLMGSLYNSNRQANKNLKTERQLRAAAQQAQESERVAREQEEQVLAAEIEAERAKAQAAQAKGLVELLNNLFRSSDPLVEFFGDAAPAELGVTGGAEGKAAAYAPFLRDAAKGIMESKAEPGSEATRAKMLSALGNALKNLGLYADAKPVLTEALALRRKVRPADNPKYNPDADPEVWQSELDLGRLETEGGDLFIAIERFQRLIEIQIRAKAKPEALLNTRFYLSVALSGTGAFEGGSRLMEVVEESDRLLGPSHRDTILAKIALFSWLLDHGELAEVVKRFPQFKADLMAIPNERVREVFAPILDAQQWLAVAFGYRRPGGFTLFTLPQAVNGVRDAIERLEKKLPEGHLVLCILRFETARSLMELPDGTAEAEVLFARVVADLRKSVGVAHPSVLTLLESYSRLLVDTGRVAEARELFDEFERDNRARFGPENPWLAVLLLKRARFEANQNNLAAALEPANGALALAKRKNLQPTTRMLVEALETVRLLSTTNDPALRTPTRELSAALREQIVKTLGEGIPALAVLQTIEGQLAHEAGDYAGAAVLLDEARQRRQNWANLFPAGWARANYWYGRVALDRGRLAEAEKHFNNSARFGDTVPEYPAKEKLANVAYYARALAAQGKFLDAAQVFEAVRQRTPSRAPEPDRAFAALELTTAHLAGENRANYQKALADLLERYGRSADPQTLARVAWAAALGGTSDSWDASAFEAQFSAALGPDATDPWAWRGLALVRLRARKLDAAEAALAKLAKARSEQPVDHLIRGLIALARNDTAAAQAALTRAQSLIEAQKPTAANPLAYAGRVWHQHAEITILLAELKGALEKGPKG